MSFSRYLHENRTLLIDHRVDHAARSAGVPIDVEAAADTGDPPTARSARRQRGRRREWGRFRHVKPAFAPSVFADPLPYLEPWERR